MHAVSASRWVNANTPVAVRTIISINLVMSELTNFNTNKNANIEIPTTTSDADLAVSASRANKSTDPCWHSECCTLWMVTNPVQLSGVGPADQELPAIDPIWQVELEAALAVPEIQRRSSLSALVARHPTYLEAWAELGDASLTVIDCYMAYRVGYHRGLDALRANGWRGSGYVRWTHHSNRGFLRCLRGVARTSRSIGELGEADRCDQFLIQLDPSGGSKS